ncbi:MAG: FAD-binding oxidoreductase, partial [Vicinamibacteria bacterium]|nr:FAD-binding oxidoreductase [Vicinamibacteria bacterium]
AMTSKALRETFDLCISCKACRRECPTGVDVARMKIEVLHHQIQRHGLSVKDRLIGYLPRYAPILSRLGGLANLAPKLPGVRLLADRLIGLSARRSLPEFRPRFEPPAPPTAPGEADVILFVDTFSTYFEPAIARSAQRVLEASGKRVGFLDPPGRPPCCGRTFLSVGLVDEARAEARRFLDAYRPWLERDVPLVGIEPSCLLTLRDEWPALLPGAETRRVARLARMFEEQIASNPGALRETLRPKTGAKAWLHGHCHQKAFGAMDAVRETLALLPGLAVHTIESGCCGMAGAFGFDRRHFDTSMQLAEMDLLPVVRAAGPEDRIVASGTSCRHQIADGAKRHAVHVAELLAEALPPEPS